MKNIKKMLILSSFVLVGSMVPAFGMENPQGKPKKNLEEIKKELEGDVLTQAFLAIEATDFDWLKKVFATAKDRKEELAPSTMFLLKKESLPKSVAHYAGMTLLVAAEWVLEVDHLKKGLKLPNQGIKNIVKFLRELDDEEDLEGKEDAQVKLDNVKLVEKKEQIEIPAPKFTQEVVVAAANAIIKKDLVRLKELFSSNPELSVLHEVNLLSDGRKSLLSVPELLIKKYQYSIESLKAIIEFLRIKN